MVTNNSEVKYNPQICECNNVPISECKDTEGTRAAIAEKLRHHPTEDDNDHAS